MSEHDFMLIDRDHSRHQNRNRFLFRVLIIGFGLIIVFITITLITFSSRPTTTRPKFITNCSISYKYDYNILTLRWPPTICNDNECTKHNSNQWLIHGLWPTYANNSWPQYCCFDRKFNVTNLDPIMAEMTTDWPNLTPKSSDESFWKHEWERHGTCTKTKQFDYFNYTLQLYKRFAVNDWLQSAGILPNNDIDYDINQFNKAFADHLGHRVQFECVKHKSAHKLMLNQIIICISHNSTTDVIDCPQESSTCEKKFFYPKGLN